MQLDFVSDINDQYAAEMRYKSVDRFVVRVHWYSFALLAILTVLNSVVKIAATYPSPLSWRVLVSLTITVFSYLFVFVSGGAIEMHFIFFVIIAMMAVYSDWRLGWIMLAAVGLHHLVLNYLAPSWVYYYGRNDIAVIAHAVPVLVIVGFTSILCRNNRNVIRDLVTVRTGLVSSVEEREKELKAALAK